MHSYAETFEQPIVVKHGDKDLTIPLLTQRDYLEWIAELTPKAIERAKKNAPPPTRVQERSNYMTWADNLEVTPGDIRPLIFRVPGTTRVLTIALKKAGLSEADATAFIDSRPVKANEMLAVHVSALFRADEISDLYPDPKAAPDPNALAALIEAAVTKAIAPLLSA
jgi:hypothetical protein